MPTIRDVAQLAGVAPITVSRVVNDSGYVSKETRARVEAAVEELEYVPNMLGPSLRFKQTMTLAMIVTDIGNPFWTTVTRGVEDIAYANGYSTFLCNTDESEKKQDQYLHTLLRRRIDGILLVPASSSPDPIRMIQKQGIPVVLIDRKVPGVDVDVVRADSENGAYRLGKHLISRGHQKISILAGPPSVSTAVDRVNGFCRAFNDSGLSTNATQVVWGDYSQESGYEMAEEALARNPKITALFATNNFVAIGALRALKEKNYRVPEDIALVAFDDISPAIMIEPFLTVTTQPAREMGNQAVRLLLERIKEGSDRPSQEIILPTEMIIRKSSKKVALDRID
jgi:LacI family transcriptional regulator